MLCRKRVSLRGIVQGVGFRPLVYRVARRLELSGFARNSSSGLTVEVEGAAGAVDAFVAAITAQPPPLARIRQIETAEIALAHDESFGIRASVEQADEFPLISPDIATCEACRRDFLDPANRRY